MLPLSRPQRASTVTAAAGIDAAGLPCRPSGRTSGVLPARGGVAGQRRFSCAWRVPCVVCYLSGAFARGRYARFRHVIHETARFGVVGLIGLVVTDGGANLLRYHAGMGRLSSVAVPTIASIAITFAPSRYWTFRHRQRTGVRRETAVF